MQELPAEQEGAQHAALHAAPHAGAQSAAYHAGAAPSTSSLQPSLSGTPPIARTQHTADALSSFACDADVDESCGGAICVAAQHQEGAPSLYRTSKRQRSSPLCCGLPWVQHSDPARIAPAQAAPAEFTVLLCSQHHQQVIGWDGWSQLQSS